MPLVLLAFGSIFIGYWGKEVLMSNMLVPVLGDEVKRVPLLFSLLGVGGAYLIILHWPSGFIRVDKVGVHVFMGSA